MSSIPVILISGHLGAGKTSLVNHVLSLPGIRKKNIALIINEFGTVGIDGALVHNRENTTYEINKGSIFCVCVKTEFLKVLQNIADQKPDLVIAEATGLADPCDLENFICEPALEGRLHVQANICVVDASSFIQVAAFMKTAERQVAWADGIIINKTDLATPRSIQTLHEVIGKINPQAAITTCLNAGIQESFIDNLPHIRHDNTISPSAPEHITAATIFTSTPVSRECFNTCIKTMGENLLRLKGIIDFGNGLQYIETVGNVIYPDKPAPENVKRAITIIARNLNAHEIKKQFSKITE